MSKTISEAQLAAAMDAYYEWPGHEIAAAAIFAALPDHDCLMPSACGVTGFWCANAKPDTGLGSGALAPDPLDAERLARAMEKVWGGWFGDSKRYHDSTMEKVAIQYARLTSSPTAEES